MTDTEILDWLIDHKCISVGGHFGGDARVVNTAGCDCCSKEISDTPEAVFDRVRSLWFLNVEPTPEDVVADEIREAGFRLPGEHG